MTPPKKPRRVYVGHNGERLAGVTTILGLLNKPALLGWAARIAADATAKAIIDGGMPRAGAIELGRKAHLKTRDHAADLGTRAHDLVERHYSEGPCFVDVTDGDDARVHGAYRRVVEHFDRTNTRVVASEIALADPDSGYGGTADFVLERDGLLIMGDLKTGKATYDEVILQLAAYRSLWHLHNPAQRITGGGLVVHSPIDGVCSEVAITNEQLDRGGLIFCALLLVYQNLPHCKLNRPDIVDESAVP